MNAMQIKSRIASGLGACHNQSEDAVLRAYSIPLPHVDAIKGQWEPVESGAEVMGLISSEPIALGLNFIQSDTLIVAGASGGDMVVWAFRKVPS